MGFVALVLCAAVTVAAALFLTHATADGSHPAPTHAFGEAVQAEFDMATRLENDAALSIRNGDETVTALAPDAAQLLGDDAAARESVQSMVALSTGRPVAEAVAGDATHEDAAAAAVMAEVEAGTAEAEAWDALSFEQQYPAGGDADGEPAVDNAADHPDADVDGASGGDAGALGASNRDAPAFRGLASTCSTTCAAGQYCAGPRCYSCPRGTAQGDASHTQTACTPCGTGDVGTVTGAARAGVNARAGATSCAPCPAGSAAYYGYICAYCRPGSANDEPGEAYPCDKCARGTVSSRVATARPGNNARLGGLHCAACPVGTWAYASGWQCPYCGPGKVNPAPGASTCTACDAGEVSTRTGVAVPGNNARLGGTVCDKCPAGTYQYRSGWQCPYCGPGRVAPAKGMNACAVCDAGEVSTRTGVAVPGNNARLGGTACAECPAGTYRYKSGWQCPYCGPGRVNKRTGQDTCDRCRAGTVSTHTGVARPGNNVRLGGKLCGKCPAGTYQYKSGWQCPYCGPGRVSRRDGASTCDACKPGHVSVRSGSARAGNNARLGGTKCAKCPAGTYQYKSGWQCPYCGPGRVASKDGASACDVCPSGHVSTRNTKIRVASPGNNARLGGLQCVPCPAGTYKYRSGWQCPYCPPGRVASTNGQDTCTVCPPGHVSTRTGVAVAGRNTRLGGIECAPCPAGLAAYYGWICA